jgi:HEAT repeat protein
VIHRLIEVLEDARDIMEKGRYQAWYDAAAILGELRAAEAIDVLVKYLDFTDGIVGFPLANRPAVNALVRIGEPAVPKLISTLLEGEGTRIRINAAEALGFIGDRHAREGLGRAVVSEQDKSVAYEIRRALSLISRRRLAKRS